MQITDVKDLPVTSDIPTPAEDCERQWLDSLTQEERTALACNYLKQYEAVPSYVEVQARAFASKV